MKKFNPFLARWDILLFRFVRVFVVIGGSTFSSVDRIASGKNNQLCFDPNIKMFMATKEFTIFGVHSVSVGKKASCRLRLVTALKFDREAGYRLPNHSSMSCCMLADFHCNGLHNRNIGTHSVHELFWNEVFRFCMWWIIAASLLSLTSNFHAQILLEIEFTLTDLS